MVTEVNSKNQLTERNFKRNEMGMANLVCIVLALITAVSLGLIANRILKVELKKK